MLSWRPHHEWAIRSSSRKIPKPKRDCQTCQKLVPIALVTSCDSLPSNRNRRHEGSHGRTFSWWRWRHTWGACLLILWSRTVPRSHSSLVQATDWKLPSPGAGRTLPLIETFFTSKWWHENSPPTGLTGRCWNPRLDNRFWRNLSLVRWHLTRARNSNSTLTFLLRCWCCCRLSISVYVCAEPLPCPVKSQF